MNFLSGRKAIKVSLLKYSLLSVLCFCGVLMAEDTHKKISASLFSNNRFPMQSASRPNVKYSHIVKDGNSFRVYDFGEGVFTIEGSHMGAFATEYSTQSVLIWPQFKPPEEIPTQDGKYYTHLFININLSEYGNYLDPYTTFINQQKPDRSWSYLHNPKELPSEYLGLKKFFGGNVFVYIADEFKSPQGTPFVLWCSGVQEFSTGHDIKDLICETNFHYYGHVAMTARATGEVLPQWQQYARDLDNYFTSRVKEK